MTPLFIAEGYIGRLPRPDLPTIDAVTKLMLAAGLSTDGQRPPIVDIYEKPAAPPQKPVQAREAVAGDTLESVPELVQQAVHHGRFVAFRHVDEAETLHRISSPEAANRDQQIQLWSNRIRHGRL